MTVADRLAGRHRTRLIGRPAAILNDRSAFGAPSLGCHAHGSAWARVRAEACQHKAVGMAPRGASAHPTRRSFAASYFRHIRHNRYSWNALTVGRAQREGAERFPLTGVASA